jgi:hypothetical protein
MRVLVCGGRDYVNRKVLFDVLDTIHKTCNIETIIQGGASGADTLAAIWAHERGVAEICFRADWAKYGRAAGMIRNKEMLEAGEPDKVVAFPGGRGTANMMKLAREAGVEVIEVA